LVARAITLDRQHELSRSFRVLRDQINSVLGGAPLRENVDSLCPKGVADILFEVVEGDVGALATRQARAAFRGVLEETAQQLDTFRLRAARSISRWLKDETTVMRAWRE
jgi:hypothetical protein